MSTEPDRVSPAGPATRARRFLSSAPRAWTLVTALTTVALVAGILAWGAETPTGRTILPIWLFMGAFAALESFPIHVQFRSESTSFSLLEIPLIIGLFMAEPSHLLIAVAVGPLIALRIVRSQPTIKLLFNAANLVLQAAVTIVVFDLLGSSRDILDPAVSAAALVAGTIGSVISISAIATVIWAAEGRIDQRKARTMILFGAIVGLANTSLALIAVTLIDGAPWAATLLAIPLAVLLVAYRAFVSERAQREQVEFLYSATKSLQATDERHNAIATLVAEATSMFRAGRVDLLLLPTVEGEPPVRYTAADDVAVSLGEVGDVVEPGLVTAEVVTEATLVTPATGGVARAYLDSLGVGEGMLAVLRGESRVIGLLVVGDRIGTATAFGTEDLRLFETLSYHAATALENDRLGQALDQLRALEQELSHLATHDTLTGLPNRLRLRQHLDRLIAEGRLDVELLFIDLDDFKLVNDTMGHASGDQLLRKVARRIGRCLGPQDVAARLGGDEFAVVVDGAERGEDLAAEILEAFTRPFVLDGASFNLGCSIGVARASSLTATSHLLRQADVAMYAAKNGGKGRIARYSTELGDQLSAHQELHQKLREAFDAGDLRVHYQPVYDLEERRIVGTEALVRWSAEDGIRKAGAFLSVAEESGFVTQIDRWVLGEVLSDIAALRKATSDDIWTGVNLSARHLQEDDVVEFIITSVRDAGIDPSLIVLEITETAAMRDIEANIAKLERLAAVGFGIALDDFGTGFSSISHLRRLPVTLLKVAQAFVSDLGPVGNDTFVTAIVQLAHTLGLPVIAEGIERPEQLKRLRALGCDMAQGFMLGEPLPAESLRDAVLAASTKAIVAEAAALSSDSQFL